jgi:hypothetical protein
MLQGRQSQRRADVIREAQCEYHKHQLRPGTYKHKTKKWGTITRAPYFRISTAGVPAHIAARR